MKIFAHHPTEAERPSGHGVDADLVQRALQNDPDAFRTIMRTYNKRLFRIARGVVRNDSVAEDIVQEAYVRAFQHLESFQGHSCLATWLHRIVLNEALDRLRKASRRPEIHLPPDGHRADILQFPNGTTIDDPEKTMAQRQILHLVEQAADALPDAFRLVFFARVIEGMSVEETALLLEIKPETVRSRLHRARYLLRKQIDNTIGPLCLDAFPFAGQRCERLTAGVLWRLGLE